MTAALATVLCVTTVENGERGVVERFGRASRELMPGIHPRLPWPIERVRTADVERSLQMPIGFRLIDRENGIEPTEREKQWLTGDTNIVELEVTVLFRIADVREWLYGVSGVHASADGVIEGRNFTLRRVAEAALTEIVAGLTIDEVLTSGLAELPVEARERIQSDVDSLGLGVFIDDVQIADSKPPVGVRSAFTDVQDAKSESERAISEATYSAKTRLARSRSEAGRIVQDAENRTTGRLAQARGDASAFIDLSDEVGDADSPLARKLVLERVRRILQNADLHTVSGGTPESPTRVFIDDAR
ncbi:MAG: protease modulator HflK [Planctomycetota bacterium]